MHLICYTAAGAPLTIVPAPVERAWMDATPSGHAYRCLPLNIANAHGWMLLNTAPFTATWNGGAGIDAVTVTPALAGRPLLGNSHFGSGVLTFHVNGLFRTDPGYDLMVTGPLNHIKDAIQPLSGVVETDWAPFTFTMNWKFTRPGTSITFDQEEPFCMIYPVPHGMIDTVEPEFRMLATDPDLTAAYMDWAKSRGGFNKDLAVPGSEAETQQWQKDYFRGIGRLSETPYDHRTRLRPKPFVTVHRWSQGGLMDQLDHEQTEANAAGRRRLRDGVLTQSETTLAITADMEIDADTLDFIRVPGFLTQAECALLAEAAHALAREGDPAAEPGDGPCLLVPQARIAQERPEAARLIRDIRRRVVQEITRFYELLQPLHTDAARLLRLPPGYWTPPGAVRANTEGTPHLRAYRDFASLVYVHDGHTGGEVHFPKLDLTVTPGAGMLLAFTAGWYHEHAMTRVEGGEQVVLSMFHTFAARRRDPALEDMET